MLKFVEKFYSPPRPEELRGMPTYDRNGNALKYNPPGFAARTLETLRLSNVKTTYKVPENQVAKPKKKVHVAKTLGSLHQFFIDGKTLNDESPEARKLARHLVRAVHVCTKEMLNAMQELGYHEISHARYASLGSFRTNSEEVPSIIVASNQDPPIQHFDKNQLKACSEKNLMQAAKEFEAGKPEVMILMRHPQEGRKYETAKILPCSDCNKKWLKKLSNNKGTLIVLADMPTLNKVKLQANLFRNGKPLPMIRELGSFTGLDNKKYQMGFVVINSKDMIQGSSLGPKKIAKKNGKVPGYGVKVEPAGGNVKRSHKGS